MKNQDNPYKLIKTTHEQGNALFLILIAIALMAGLAFALSKGDRGGKTLLTDGNAKIEASHILKYAQSIATSLQNIQFSNGCSENDLSFEAPQLTGYVNAGAPADKSCHIFNVNGGGQQYLLPPYKALNTPEDWIFSGAHEIDGVGTAAVGDLVLYLQEIKDSTCEEINRLLKITTPETLPTDATALTLTKYIGAFANGAAPNNDDARTAGQQSACVTLTTPSHNVFYHTLIIR